MKRNQLALIFVLVSLIHLLSIGVQQSASAAERLLPTISFEKSVCDLGEVGQGTKNSCEFRFTNTGRCLNFDPKTQRYVDNAEANKMLTRNYRKPFVVPKNV